MIIKYHVSTAKIDYLLEWYESCCDSLQPIVNSDGGDVPQMVNHGIAFKVVLSWNEIHA